ncbi:LCP family protein [Tumebacillus lipolyticus]|uniref:LCP family protein n=1 Tax=Tumebacillus lipolyticus TaxID=1280370 RepID=A0ABW4ZVV3_9BACL
MNRMSPNRKRLWVASWVLLCILFAASLGGFYKLYRVAEQIYEPSASPYRADGAGEQPDGAAGGREAPAPLKKGASEAADERRGTSAKQPELQPERQMQASLLPAPSHRSGAARQTVLSKRVETFLLLGVDSRHKGERARADTILLATVPELGGDVHLMSIPRDTYVQVAGHGYTKINHAMSYGGLPLLRRTVQDFLRVPIDHTMIVDFEGFRKVIDEIGGLNLQAEKSMDYEDAADGTSIHLRKGQQLSTGKLALDYARFRSDSEADTGRMRRQQQVIRAMIQQGGKPDNWARMFRLAEIVGEHVQTDVPPREWVRLIMSYAYNQPEQIKTLKIEGVNRIAQRDKLWYFFVSDAERRRVQAVLEQLRRGNA